MIILIEENIENKVIFSESELELLKKIEIKDTDMIQDTITMINIYICKKYNVPAICMVNKLEKEDIELLSLKDKIYKCSLRLT